MIAQICPIIESFNITLNKVNEQRKDRFLNLICQQKLAVYLSERIVNFESLNVRKEEIIFFPLVTYV